MIKLAIALCLASAAFAQPLPSTLAGAGAGWNQYSTPQINGWWMIASKLGDTSTYSVTTWDVTSKNTQPFTAQVSIRTGVAQVLKRFKGVTTMALGDIGGAAGDTNIGGAYSGGGAAVITIGKTNWHLIAAARRLKTTISDAQTIYEIGFGRSF